MRQPTKPSGFCNVINVILVIVIVWLGFLYYYHHSSLHNAEKAVMELRTTSLKDLMNKVAHLTQEELKVLHDVVHQEHPIHDTPALIMQDVPPAVTPKVVPVEPVASVVTPKEVSIPKSPTIQASQQNDEEEKIHVAFSTDCTFFQDWQTLLIFYTAMSVKQPGKITRIASGCTPEKQEELTKLYQKLYPQYSVHFTPDFKSDGKTKKKYDFYNKPYGVQHWLTNAVPSIDSGTIISVIDPDMIFLRPMTSQIRNNPSNIYMHRFNPDKEEVPERVKHGVPVGQLYGLGAPWTNDHHRHFNRTEICGLNSPCLETKTVFGEQHFSVGPPYMLEKDDFLKLATAWTTFVPRVYAKYSSLLAEMYAYSMAAAHTELPHFTMHNLMVSNVHAGDEGWKWIDVLGDNVCEDPEDGFFYPGKNFPTVLHFCQFYRAGEYGFQKRRIKKQVFECDHPMMAELPRDIGKVDYKNRDGEIIKLGKTEARRNAFMLCTVHRSINAMLTHYKSIMCPADSVINHSKTINVVAKGYY